MNKKKSSDNGPISNLLLPVEQVHHTWQSGHLGLTPTARAAKDYTCLCQTSGMEAETGWGFIL